MIPFPTSSVGLFWCKSQASYFICKNFHNVSLKDRLLFKNHSHSIIVMPKFKKSLISSNIQCLNFPDFVKIRFHIKKNENVFLGFTLHARAYLHAICLSELRSTVLGWYISWNREEFCRAPPSTKAPPCLLPLVCRKAGLPGCPESPRSWLKHLTIRMIDSQEA